MSDDRAPMVFSTRVAVAVVIAFGVVLRLLGFFELELWSDEGGWCKRLIDGDYGWIRPIGYMWITKQLLTTIEVNEQVLRSLSYVAGLAQLPLMYLVLRRVVARPVFAVAGTYLLAIHPIAVAMTKEFKPYAVESALHTLFVALVLVYLAKGSARALAAVLLTAVLAPLFAWTIIFTYPGAFLVLGFTALRARRRAHVVATVAGCVATLGMLLVLFSARLAAQRPDAGYWGTKYDVFFLGNGVLDRLTWSLQKTADIASFPAHLQWFWPASTLVVVQVLCVALCALGVVALIVRKQWALATLLVGPWPLTFAFNAAGVWPYGLFRTNLFLLFYTTVLVIVGLDFIAQIVRARPALVGRTLAAFGIALAVLLFPFELSAFQHKRPGTLTAEASVRRALEKIYLSETGTPWSAPIDEATAAKRREGAAAARKARGDSERALVLDEQMGREVPLLLMDGHACSIMRYYRDYDSSSAPVFQDWLRSHFVTKCATFGLNAWQRTLKSVRGRSFWLVAAKGGWPAITRKELAPYCDVLVDEVMPDSTLLYRCRAKAAAPVETLQPD